MVQLRHTPFNDTPLPLTRNATSWIEPGPCFQQFERSTLPEILTSNAKAESRAGQIKQSIHIPSINPPDELMNHHLIDRSTGSFMRNIENLANKVLSLQLCISQIKTALHLTQNLWNCCSNDRITRGPAGRRIFESLSNTLFVGQNNTDDIVLRTRHTNDPVKLTIFGEPHQSPPSRMTRPLK